MPSKMRLYFEKLWNMLAKLRLEQKQLWFAGSMHTFLAHLMVPGDVIWVHLRKNKNELQIPVRKGSDQAQFWRKAFGKGSLSMLNSSKPAGGFYVPQVITYRVAWITA